MLATAMGSFISLRNFVFSLYAVFFITLLVLPIVPKGIALLLLLVGIVGFAVYRGKLLIGFSPEERLLIWVFSAFTFISFISFLVFPYSRMSHYRMEDYATFMLILPMFLLLRQWRFKLNTIVVLFSFVATLLGVVSLLQLWSMQSGSGYFMTFDNPMAQFWNRPSGVVNPMRYAAISLIFFAFALNALVFVKRQSALIKTLLFVAMISAGIACALTQVRGAWLAFFALVFTYGCAFFYLGYRKRVVAFFAVAIIVVVSVAQFDFVEQRIHKTERAFEMYMEGNSGSSLGARLDMFKTAWWLINERPWFGHGLNSYSANATEIRENTPGMNPEVGRWHNPHNEILNATVEKGVIGLISMLLLFVAPGLLFLKAFLVNRGTGSVAYLSFCGISVLIVYFVAGLSVALFEHDIFNHFYVLTVLFLASQVHSHSSCSTREERKNVEL
ncbi:hypothetical protein RED65_00260 [Oceanobacter sp. RED65]|uniref:O-antigen ligase-related domain-containing protein n=2 Tax=Bermanella marisrubri TaxID=207949 RepID=Q1N5A2_9GAMM|nr:hypothetical protein RED65_00260 [Oceanobacter sp. RED65] [Bermanella marisrubri]